MTVLVTPFTLNSKVVVWSLTAEDRGEVQEIVPFDLTSRPSVGEVFVKSDEGTHVAGVASRSRINLAFVNNSIPASELNTRIVMKNLTPKFSFKILR